MQEIMTGTEQPKISEPGWENIFNAVGHPAIITDPHFRVVAANSASRRLTGRLPHEVIGMHCVDIIYAKDTPVCVNGCRLQALLKAGSHEGPETEMETPAGTFLVSCTPVLDKHGNLEKIVHIGTDITERKEAEELIQNSLREKEALLKEVHHRVKNNLQIIYSLLRLQSQQTANETVRTFFAETQNRVRSIASVHELLYQSKDLSHIDFAEYARKLVAHLLGSCGAAKDRITLLLDTPSVNVSIDNAIPLGLIINELVSNSLKYAFPENRSGEIAIAIVPGEEGSLLLTVADNGIGSPEGLDLRNTGSLGMQLVMTLVTQLRATIDFENYAGLKTIINIPGGQPAE